MCAYALRQNGYANATRSTGMPRDVEYQLFSRVTGKLNRASGKDGSFAELAEALHENLVLWRTIAVDVADEKNELPQSLRARLFYMFEFTTAHTRKVLQRQADPNVLIEINTSIMRGLRPNAPGKGQDECQA